MKSLVLMIIILNLTACELPQAPHNGSEPSKSPNQPVTSPAPTARPTPAPIAPIGGATDACSAQDYFLVGRWINVNAVEDTWTFYPGCRFTNETCGLVNRVYGSLIAVEGYNTGWNLVWGSYEGTLLMDVRGHGTDQGYCSAKAGNAEFDQRYTTFRVIDANHMSATFNLQGGPQTYVRVN